MRSFGEIVQTLIGDQPVGAASGLTHSYRTIWLQISYSASLMASGDDDPSDCARVSHDIMLQGPQGNFVDGHMEAS